MLSSIISGASDHHERELRSGDASFEGRVLLRKKRLFHHVLGIGDVVCEFLGDKVTLQLVSAHQLSAVGGIGFLSPEVQLRSWNSEVSNSATDQDIRFSITVPVDKEFGNPGALLVRNKHHNEFYLSSVTISSLVNPTQEFHFLCNSWIYNTEDCGPRIFFTNEAYLPNETPCGIVKLRNAELKTLQGDGTGERKGMDRIYDYDVYNDLGNPDKGKQYARQTLGATKNYPYPRRCRTGRESNESDPNTEKPVSTFDLIYVPRDEIFDHSKTSDFLASSVKAIVHTFLPAVEELLGGRLQFKSLEEVNNLYVEGLVRSISTYSEEKRDDTKSGLELISELIADKDTGNKGLLKFPLPQVIATSKDAWRTDEEFGRQTLGGMHPMVIERLTVFPPYSKLDPTVYGPPSSSIKAHHIEPYLGGMSVHEALKQNKLYIIDYHDAYLPYIERINALKDHRTYASRTIFFLTKKGTLKPIAIELSLLSGNGRVDRVFVPPQINDNEEQKYLWLLAKTHAILNDTPVHQLISHLLRTHVCIEPFVIASHRQLSVMHPLLVLLLPHFKNTMNINALARKILINAYSGNAVSGGIVEQTFTAGRYALEMSSMMYKNWRFDEQGLPADLIKRGMAVRDPKAKHGIRLLVEDYPYAVDGLDIWAAIESWVDEYLHIYYETDDTVVKDTELQNWWREIREQGHGDKKDEPWWLPMDSINNLISIATTIIWLASAHHAAVNFGQYPYAGYMPYRPTMGRQLIPLPNTPEYAIFVRNPEAFLLASVSSPFQTAIALAIIEVLSTHASVEEYLGQRPIKLWTDNSFVLDAFKRFQNKLLEVEKAITERNEDMVLVNRYGEVQVPYTLLFPRSGDGITNKGIPNSISI